MKVLVNALSVTNPSGAHVLLGHVGEWVREGRFRVALLCRESMTAFRERLEGRCDWRLAPEYSAHWLQRSVWERTQLARVAREIGADVYFTPSGIAAARLDIPQIVFCQNPWSLVPAARRRRDAPKAALQRAAYRRAQRIADVLVFNSRYMREAYRRNAGFSEKRGFVVYQAADDSTHRRAAELKTAPRRPGQILCVSVMAPHKNVETVLRALARLRTSVSNAALTIAGPWPCREYERRMRRLAERLGVADRVRFAGFVAREELDRLYAEAMAFCLLSRCESFGIPAVEAQIFGTPVVGSNVCAVPEICGAGGRYFGPDDAEGAADALGRLLTDAAHWREMSERARANGRRFTWSECARPWSEVFSAIAQRQRAGSRGPG